MAPDDRDRIFEKALARHLRSSAPSVRDSRALSGSADAACPDAETLAAYHDGSLSSEELVLWKQHVVGCKNCQLVLAHLETPLELPVNVAEKESVVAGQRPVSSTASVSPARVIRPRRPPSMRWLWLVPAGAAAASLIAWISLHQQKTMQVPQPPSVEIAENLQAPAPAAPPVAHTSKSARVAPLERKEKDQSASRSPGAGEGSAGSPQRDDSDKPLNNRGQLVQNAPNQFAAAPAHGPSLSMQKQQQQQTSGVVGGSVGAATGAAVLDEKKAAAPAPAKSQQRIKQAAPPLPAPNEPALAANETAAPAASQPAPSPAPAAAADKSKSGYADAVSSTSETVEVTSAAPPVSKMMGAAFLKDTHVFSAPDKKHLWRVGPVGLLEFSKNGGAKWKPQVSGVTVDLTSASAPSEKVCWVVGRSGTILRTTDAGAHWTQLHSPLTADLAGVSATDAQHASVWAVPDEQTGLVKSYMTTDGGSIWILVPND